MMYEPTFSDRVRHQKVEVEQIIRHLTSLQQKAKGQHAMILGDASANLVRAVIDLEKINAV
jgi:hypothetical protein